MRSRSAKTRSRILIGLRLWNVGRGSTGGVDKDVEREKMGDDGDDELMRGRMGRRDERTVVVNRKGMARRCLEIVSRCA